MKNVAFTGVSMGGADMTRGVLEDVTFFGVNQEGLTHEYACRANVTYHGVFSGQE
jgi:hypothetical protein